MDRDEIEQVVRGTVHDVAKEVAQYRGDVRNSDVLTNDLGLRSLDLARIITLLEVKLDSDPFASHVSVTSIRTVGDLCDAYGSFAEGAPADDSSLDQGAERAKLRQSLGGRAKT